MSVTEDNDWQFDQNGDSEREVIPHSVGFADSGATFIFRPVRS